MEQTFHDLYLEQKQSSNRGLFSFIVWMFIETTIGIVREYVLLMEETAMKNFFMTLRSPALISLLLVIPFMIMEIVNRRGFGESFPIPLFVMMWILPLIFIVTAMPIIRNLRAGNSLMAQPVKLLIRIVILVFVSWLWTSLLIDQMPCFLGVPNCD